jgi:hypothetical protein
MFGALKHDINFEKLFCWENIFGKLPYYGKEKQGK